MSEILRYYKLSNTMDHPHPVLEPSDQLQVAMLAFRCYQCHQRDGAGGVAPERDSYFHTDNPNLGPQGRIPPTLSQVGAKLKPKWMRQVLVSGRSVRPYVKTRMPQYGTENIEPFIELFQNLDHLDPRDWAEISDPKEAKKIGSFFSYDMPNSVFVTENNTVQLPAIELYHAQIKGKDFLFLSGDAQPSVERASYELTEEILQIAKQHKAKQVVALGGIGLAEVPSAPQVYVTGTHETIVKEFKSAGASDEVFGMVGPIVGVSGLLLGLANRFELDAAALLGETFGHPMYIGLKEARCMLDLLNKKYDLDVDFSTLDEEIALLETDEEGQPKLPTKLKKRLPKQDTNYIG